MEAATEPRPRFCVDGMAIQLGKYLRCLGYDATWDAAAPTRVLARRAAAEERVLLTRNTRIGHEIHPRGPVLQLASDDPVEQLTEVRAELGLALDRLFTRCIRCNVELEEVAEPATVRERVPPAVLRRHRLFWTCPRCGTVFWLGSHVTRTCAKLGLEPPPGTRG